MSGFADQVLNIKRSIAGLIIAAVVGINPAQAQDMTAGLILEKMQPEERFAYVNGIVTGMAYARFRQDTLAAGSKDERGMTCIYDWFHKGDGSTYAMLDATFRKNSQHTPAVIIASLLKKECGE